MVLGLMSPILRRAGGSDEGERLGFGRFGGGVSGVWLFLLKSCRSGGFQIGAGCSLLRNSER